MKKYMICLFLGLAHLAYSMEHPMRMMPMPYAERPSADDDPDSSAVYAGLNQLGRFEYKPTEARRQIHEMALANAPEEIKEILISEQHPDEYRRNVLLLHGATGTGKTTLAEAIGCHLGKCFFVPAVNLMSKYRYGTLERLNYLFDRVVKEPGKKTLVLNDMDVLTQHYTSKHTDAGATSDALGDNLDRFQSDLNFFFIGTVAEPKKLPPRIKDRFLATVVEITSDHCDKRQLIEYYLSVLNIPKDPSINEQFITQLTEKLRDFSPRDIGSIIACAQGFASLEPSAMLTPASIEEVLQKRKYDLEHDVWDFSKPISDDDRRHQERLSLQRKLHEERMAQQRELHEAQQRRQRELMQRKIGIQTQEKNGQEEEAKEDSLWTRLINAGRGMTGNALTRKKEE